MEKEHIPGRPLFSAHRGAADLAPENTLPALEMALTLGIPMLEVDVRPSLDGILYDLHDPRVDRTTKGTGALSRMRSAEIDHLDAGELFSKEFQGVRIPRVEEVVAAFQRRAFLYFDVKEGVDWEALVQLIRRYALQRQPLFWFKDSREALKFKSFYPAYSLKVNAGEPEEVREKAKTYGPAVIECSFSSYSEEMYRTCRELGLKLMISLHGKEEEYAQNPGGWKADILNIHNVKPLLPFIKNHVAARDHPGSSKGETYFE